MKYEQEWLQVQELVKQLVPHLPEGVANPYDPAVFTYETFERDIDIGVSNGYDLTFQMTLFKLLIDSVVKSTPKTENTLTDAE